MKIVADTNIPFLKGVFEPYGEVLYKDGRSIERTDCLDADVLIIRTRTKCDAAMLEGTRVKVVATATIGMDHVDIPWCIEHGITVYNAEGCNAGGVVDYVLSALYGVASRKAIRLEGATIGIVGVGHVGARVAEAAEKLGFQVLMCDPPRAEMEGPDKFCTLDFLLENAQVVTMHTPLEDSTRIMADEIFFQKIAPGTIFINTSRGEVVDEAALMRARPKLGAVVIDTWCNEPDVNRNLIEICDIATPHIAGYSYQGKQMGTAMAVRSVAKHYGIDALKDYFPETESPDLAPIRIVAEVKSQGEMTSVLQYNYPIFTDDFFFRSAPENFEKIRSEYRYRREFYID